jgi:hypothetical protein
MIDSSLKGFLSHHGIKGMKWGVRNKDSGGGSSSSAKDIKKASKAVKMVSPDELKKRETKAKTFDKEAARLRTENSAIQAKIKGANVFQQRSYKNQIAENEKLIDTAKKDAVAVRSGKMTSRQKKLLIGTAIAGGILAAYGAQYMVESGELSRLQTKGKRFLDKDGGLFKKNDKLSNPNYSADDILKNVIPGVNPDYGSWGTNMNCRRATFAYEMRRRGFDVQATKTSIAHGQTLLGLAKATTTDQQDVKSMKHLSSYFAIAAGSKNLINTSHVADGGKSIFDALSKEPNGSRGEFAVMWASAVPGIPGGGHSMAYEVINGKAHIFDTQNGKEYKTGNDVFGMIAEAGYTRLDNVDLNMNFLSKWVR